MARAALQRCGEVTFDIRMRPIAFGFRELTATQGCVVMVCVQRARVYIGAYCNAPGKAGSFIFIAPFR